MTGRPSPLAIAVTRGRAAFAGIAALLLVPLWATTATAEDTRRQHVVTSGEVLGTIAAKHRVSVSALLEANHLTNANHVRVGQRLELPPSPLARDAEPTGLELPPSPPTREAGSTGTATKNREDDEARHTHPPTQDRPPEDAREVTHVIKSGESLSRIAAHHNVTVATLCKRNGLNPKRPIRPGKKLVVPGSRFYKPPVRHSWDEYSGPARRAGYVTLTGHGKRWSGYVIGPKDEILGPARTHISLTLASWRTGKHVTIDDRLIRLLARVSDQFGGRPLRIVSGYREHSHARQSKHPVGLAVDFSVPGVPNAILRDYLRSLERVGVGYYPNSTHVHLDVRHKTTYWVDDSRPGQAPRYRHGPNRAPRQQRGRTASPAVATLDAARGNRRAM